jgi:tetratricopeptide (TPR) repeat protein
MLGNNHQLQAAKNYYRTAESAFNAGAFQEADQLCHQALQLLRLLPDEEPERNRLHAKTVLLSLICSWEYGAGDQETKLNLLALADEGETSAARLENLAALAEIKAIRGQLLVQLGNVPEAIRVMREALELARASGSRMAECYTLLHLGSQLAKENLAESMKMRYEALDLFEQAVKPARSTPKMAAVERYFYRFSVYIGVGEFDSGNYSLAVEHLNRGIAQLKQLKMWDALQDAMNYLGQVYVAMGLYEQAEETLLEITKLRENDKIPQPWTGNNLALLGKLYLEWGKIELAEKPMLEGWAITAAAKQADLITIVRNYYAELLMHPDYEKQDVARAERYLTDNIEESRRAGLYRSTVTALALRSQLALQKGHIENAVHDSGQAVAYIRKMGTLPAVRLEEIYYAHFQALQAAQRGEEAREYLKKAYDTLQEKANRIKDDSHRRIFLEKVRLSHKIILASSPHFPT